MRVEMKGGTSPNIEETHPLSFYKDRALWADGVLFEQCKSLVKILCFIIRIIIGVESNIEILKVNIFVENDELPDWIGDWFLDLPSLSLNEEVLKRLLASIHDLAFLSFAKVRKDLWRWNLHPWRGEERRQGQTSKELKRAGPPAKKLEHPVEDVWGTGRDRVWVAEFRAKRCPSSFLNCPILLFFLFIVVWDFWDTIVIGRSRVPFLNMPDFEPLSKFLKVVNSLSGFETDLLEGICESCSWPAFLDSFIDQPVAGWCSDIETRRLFIDRRT
jgi:hypothetical protein